MWIGESVSFFILLLDHIRTLYTVGKCVGISKLFRWFQMMKVFTYYLPTKGFLLLESWYRLSSRDSMDHNICSTEAKHATINFVPSLEPSSLSAFIASKTHEGAQKH